MSRPMMACGCTADGTTNRTDGVDHEPIPTCTLHHCAEQVPDPDLTGRIAKCSERSGGKLRQHPDGAPVPSVMTLPFFRHRPDAETDSYYCGCWGWD